MALRRIFTDDAECLYKVARPVEKFDARLHTLLDDMADTMYHAEGVGLAAPQIGILRRVVVIDCGDGLIEAINPEIIETSGEQGDFEGCLSFPGKHGYVIRPNHVVMRAYNRFGELMEYRGEGLLARAMLHECDHLDGHVYLEKVTEAPEGMEEEYMREYED
ncbi:MAG: peptide deformylase [Christensenellales bacterium]|nr:peptide deformylase [Clostridium sp.]MDY2926426.1 peptide deformylase [Eubacteriales bacterium]MCI6817056.1 peptide deformylase [Clostridium sp.]MCI6987346.1 peptide deformylase [Clostridium sp.]MCI7013020.1 peptide deformylase [Clostridium sp.]